MGFVSPFGETLGSSHRDAYDGGKKQQNVHLQKHRPLANENQPPTATMTTSTTTTVANENHCSGQKKKETKKKYSYWRCLFAKRKATQVKRKTLKFEDGCLRVDGDTNESVLYNEKGEKKAKGKPGTIVEGTECSLQQYEIEIEGEISE